MTETIHQGQADPAAEQIIARLADLPNPTRIKDLPQLNSTIDELSRIMDTLPSGYHNRDLIDRVDELRRRYVDKRERLKIIEEARLLVNDYLDAARRLHESRNTLVVVVEQYDNATSHIRGLRDGKNWDEADVVELSVLAGIAEGAREEYLNDHERPTTRQEGGQLATQILRFAEQARKDPEYLVTYFREPSFNAPSEQMPVKMALQHARGLLLNLWESKTTEYLDLARQKLENHKPRDARGELLRIGQLPGRENPEIGVELPKDTLHAIEDMRARVDKDVAALDAAESELRQANGILDSNEPDALTADKHYLKAMDHYAFAPAKDATRARIVDIARQEIAPLMDTADAQLKREAWGQVILALSRLEKLLALQRADAMLEARARYDSLNAVFKSIEPFATGPKLNPSEERELLSQLAATYADDYWPSWEGLNRRLARLQTLRNLQSLEEKIDAACKPAASLAELEDLAEALADLQNNPPGDAPKDKLAKIPTMSRRVNGWLGYARARDELAKAPKGGISPTVLPDALDLHDIADLKVAKAGLEATKQDRIAEEAARQHRPNLFVQLQELERYDNMAYRVLSDAQEFLEQGGRPSTEELQSKIGAIKRELGRPTSYRQALLVIYHEIRERLLSLYSDELRKTLDNDRKNYFKNLIDIELDQRLSQLKQVTPEDEETNDYLVKEVELARSMARAHRIVHQVRDGVSNWDDAQQAWETARIKADVGSDNYNFALHQERQAHKQAVFRKSVNASETAAAELLKNLTNDPILRDDWEVWYRHGDYLFTLVRNSIAPNLKYEVNVQNLPRARELVEEARRSLTTANALVQGTPLNQPEEIDNREKLSGLLIAIHQWDTLLRTFNLYQETLDDSNPQQADYLNLIRAHEDTDNQLIRPQDNSPDAKRWHNGLWIQVRGVAKIKLEDRINSLPTGDIIGRLNALLGLVILFPGEDTVQQEMINQSAQILHDLHTLVDESIGDYGGSNFTRRFLAREKHSPEPENHLSYQLDEARNTTVALESYRQTLVRVNLSRFAVSDTLLAGMTDKLAGWVDELEAYRDALENAIRLSQDGLRDPSQFEMARRILRVAQSAHTDLPQVPSEFINANHPTYRWATDDIEHDYERRRRQEALRDKINELIREEQSGVVLALRARDGDTVASGEWQKVVGLENTLRQLRDALHEMITSEDEDPTFLQQNLIYQMPELREQYYRGAKNIRDIITAKLEQYRFVSVWLEGWTDPANNLLKVIDWPKEKKKIVSRRNRGPGEKGLNEALRLCREALRNNSASNQSDGRLPLLSAHEELSLGGMRQVLGGSNHSGPDQNLLLYGIIEPLNKRRADLQAVVADYIAQAEKMETNIIWRSNNFQTRFDNLIAKKEALLTAVRFPPWKPWEQIAAYGEFQRAVQEFCDICPEYQAFEEAKEDARRHTGRNFYCPEEG